MQAQLEESNKRMIFRVRVLGIFCVLLALGYFLLFRGGVFLVLIDALIAIVASLILVGIFALYMPIQIERQLEDEISVGRYFLGCGMGLSIAFLLGIIALLFMGIQDPSDLLIDRRLEALFFIPFNILVFISAGLSFNLGYRYHRLTMLVEPSKGSLFVQGGFFIAVGIPCLAVSVILFILAAFWSGPINEVLTLIAFSLMVLFFVIFIFSAFLDVGSQTRKSSE